MIGAEVSEKLARQGIVSLGATVPRMGFMSSLPETCDCPHEQVVSSHGYRALSE